MNIGVYPGSFDPATNGHMDIIKRSTKIVDHLVVGVLHNQNKTPLFSVEERINILKTSTKDLPNVEIKAFSGLLIDFVNQEAANLIIRGLRAVSDFEYELQMAQTNRSLNDYAETVFLATKADYSFLSSSLIKEVTQFGGNIEQFVPPIVQEKLLEKYNMR